jgi:hypothetical protein
MQSLVLQSPPGCLVCGDTTHDYPANWLQTGLRKKPSQRATRLDGCRYGREARHCAQSRLNRALARRWHAAYIGAKADLEKESAMHPTIQTENMKTRPSSAPAYYLARPASFWLTVTTRRAGAPDAVR